jgi:hypothetical protein
VAWKRWGRWTVLVGVLAAAFGHWCLRAIAMVDPSTPRLTLVPSRRIRLRDLEARVAAPEAARGVTITLPDGETRLAHYDPDRGLWTLRFFIDEGSPERLCTLGVGIVGADGRAESLQLPYSTSSRSPVVRISLRRVAEHAEAVEITARSIVAAQGTTAAGVAVNVVEDARHVEVLMPDGRLVILGPVEDGVFRGYWRPRRMSRGPLRIRVASVDRALDERVGEASLVLPSAATADAGIPANAPRRR